MEEVESEIMQVWWFGLDGNAMCGSCMLTLRKVSRFGVRCWQLSILFFLLEVKLWMEPLRPGKCKRTPLPSRAPGLPRVSIRGVF
jgi:hypothetical protein